MSSTLRPYVILATMTAAFHNDTIVYSAWAESPAKARDLVYDLYIEQGWLITDIATLDAYVIRSSHKPALSQIRQIAGSEARHE